MTQSKKAWSVHGPPLPSRNLPFKEWGWGEESGHASTTIRKYLTTPQHLDCLSLADAVFTAAYVL